MKNVKHFFEENKEIFALLGVSVCGLFLNNLSKDESGTIVSKQHYELKVDIDGDQRPDRVIVFCVSDDKTLYNYARVGDRISYKNDFSRGTTIGADDDINRIKKINGVTATKIFDLKGARNR